MAEGFKIGWFEQLRVGLASWILGPTTWRKATRFLRSLPPVEEHPSGSS